MQTTVSGKDFVLVASKNFGIHPRTKRVEREGECQSVRFHTVVETIIDTLRYAGYWTPEAMAIYEASAGVLRGWEKHVIGGRMRAELVYELNQLSPYQCLKLTGRMLDDGVTNVGEFEAWFYNHEIRSQ